MIFHPSSVSYQRWQVEVQQAIVKEIISRMKRLFPARFSCLCDQQKLGMRLCPRRRKPALSSSSMCLTLKNFASLYLSTAMFCNRSPNFLITRSRVRVSSNIALLPLAPRSWLAVLPHVVLVFSSSSWIATQLSSGCPLLLWPPTFVFQ
jgi:hypothetical protein